jgi:hypothetical protein
LEHHLPITANSFRHHSEQIVAFEGQKENRAGGRICAVFYLVAKVRAAIRVESAAIASKFHRKWLESGVSGSQSPSAFSTRALKP